MMIQRKLFVLLAFTGSILGSASLPALAQQPAGQPAVSATPAQAVPQAAPAADPLARAKQIGDQVCAACHGADGNSPIAVNPKLASQHPAYLYKQLHNFKAWNGKQPERVSPVMNGIAATLTEAEMQSLGQYYGRQTIKPAVTTNKETLDLGRRLWRAGDAAKGVPACAGCHGAAGAGIPAQFPRLQGQFAEYTAAQLTAFRQGQRTNDANRMMQMIAAKMSDAEIRAVSDYIAGLR